MGPMQEAVLLTGEFQRLTESARRIKARLAALGYPDGIPSEPLTDAELALLRAARAS